MAYLKPGDRVDVRIKSATIVGPYRRYDEIKTFEVIASYNHGYYLYVPYYYSLNDTVVLTPLHCQDLGIDKRFLNENVVFIQENMVCRVHYGALGIRCQKCHEFFDYAEPNQENGCFTCYSCRFNPYR